MVVKLVTGGNPLTLSFARNRPSVTIFPVTLCFILLEMTNSARKLFGPPSGLMARRYLVGG